MKRYQLWISMLMCVCLLNGCGSVADKTISVEATSIRNDVFNIGYATVGLVEPQSQVDVIPKYSGTVEEAFKEVGESVNEGDILLQIDTTAIMNQIKTAQASYGQANAAIAQANAGVEQANTNVAMANSSVDKAKKGVEQSKVGLENAEIGLSAIESGANQQTLLQLQASVDNAKITYDLALLSQQKAQLDYNDSMLLFEAGAISKGTLDTIQEALDKANASLATAKTALDTAQKNLDLYSGVISEKNIASADANVKIAAIGVDGAYSAVEGANASLDNAYASVDAAKAAGDTAAAAANTSRTQLEILESQLNDYTVKSPISGVVINKNIERGAMAGQTPAYTIAYLDKVVLTTSIPKSEINKLSLGGLAQVFYEDNSYVVTEITAISNAANASGLYMVQVSVDNKSNKLKPGITQK